jgi:hypothetical protein
MDARFTCCVLTQYEHPFTKNGIGNSIEHCPQHSEAPLKITLIIDPFLGL